MISGINGLLYRRSLSAGREVCAEFREGNEQASRNELLTPAAADGLATASAVELCN